MGFEQYVAGHGRKLLRLAFLLTRDTYLAEDLTRSVLADAYRHWSKVERRRIRMPTCTGC